MERNKIIVLLIAAVIVLSPLIYLTHSTPVLGGDYRVVVRAKVVDVEENVFLIRSEYPSGLKVLGVYGDYYLVEVNDENAFKRILKKTLEVYQLADVNGNVVIEGIPVVKSFKAYVFPGRKPGDEVNLDVFLTISGGRITNFIAVEKA